MDDALDTNTWEIVIGVLLGFFAVPVAMLIYDMRRQRRQRSQAARDRFVPTASPSLITPYHPRRSEGPHDVVEARDRPLRLDAALPAPSVGVPTTARRATGGPTALTDLGLAPRR